tara:strand:+ start:259 stop:555 length:297 start_codon:yes stop_codon:yes gene_type:complete
VIWLGLNVIFVSLLAGAVSFLLLGLFKTVNLTPNGIALSAIAVILTVLALFGIANLAMQFTHIVPVAGAMHLALGSLVALMVSPSWIGWMNSKGLLNG